MQAPLLGLAVLAVMLTLVFWLGSSSLQNYLYNEASEWLYWQAPAAAVVMTLFLLLWSMLNMSFVEPQSRGVPFGLLWEFSPRVDIIADAVPQIESKRRNSKAAIYVVDKSGFGEVRYRKKDGVEFWSAVGTEYVKFTHDGQEFMFIADQDRSQEEGYVVFVDADSGLEMSEYEVGRVGYTSYLRLWIYALLNVGHLALWVICCWLLLRFHFWHAVGLALVMWGVFMIAVLPALFAN